MKHAGETALYIIGNLLTDVRQITQATNITETKPGIFYQKSLAVLHFHEDPAGLFADLKIAGKFVRFPVNTPDEQRIFLRELKTSLEKGFKGK